MEYYGLRSAGADIDLIVTQKDMVKLLQQYPTYIKDLFADLGICVFGFEIWKTICYLSYQDLLAGAIDAGDFLVISLEKLLLLKSFGIHKPKYLEDVRLIVAHLVTRQNKQAGKIKLINQDLLKDIPNIHYIEKKDSQDIINEGGIL